MPIIPNTNIPGWVLISGGSGQNGSSWSPLPDSKTFAIKGTIDTDPVPPFFYPVVGTAILTSVEIQLLSGTCTLDIQQNGSNIAGLTSLSITTSPQNFMPNDVTYVMNLDLFGPNIDSVSSADGLTITFIFQVSL